MDEQPPSVALVGYARFSLPQQQQVSLPLPAPDSTRTSGGGHDAAGGAQPPALLACGATSTLIALIDGRVYACGAELGGELLGAACSAARHTDVASNLVELPLAPPVPCSRSVLALACGPHHVFMALAGGGGVWAWGLDATGQTLGLGGCNRRWCLSCGGNKSGGQETGTDSSTVTAPRYEGGLCTSCRAWWKALMGGLVIHTLIHARTRVRRQPSRRPGGRGDQSHRGGGEPRPGGLNRWAQRMGLGMWELGPAGHWPPPPLPPCQQRWGGSKRGGRGGDGRSRGVQLQVRHGWLIGRSLRMVTRPWWCFLFSFRHINCAGRSRWTSVPWEMTPLP